MAGRALGWIGRASAATLRFLSAAIPSGRVRALEIMSLPNAVDGERRTAHRRSGSLSYYVTGAGAPILLIHSINAAASAYEVKPFVEELCAEHRVYAVDLPGFGFSDRSDRRYEAALYVSAIHDMLDEIAAESGSAHVDALALSLSSEFLARAGTQRPETFRTLAFVTPTGFDRRSARRTGSAEGTREVRGLYAFLNLSFWSRGLYNLLVTRRSIRFFLERTWGSKRIDEGVLDYDYLTAHQPGARHAPYAFVSGRLFSRDARAVYERLTVPILVLHGTKGDFQDFSGIEWTRGRANWDVVPLDAGALPHFERLPEVMARYRPFLAQPHG